MSRFKLDTGRAALTFLAMVLGCSYLVHLGACTPSSGGGDGGGGDGGMMNSNGGSSDDPAPNLNIGTATCNPIDENSTDYETSLAASTTDGTLLSYTRRVITNPDEGDGIRIETEVMADGELVMTVVTTTDGAGGVQTQIDYGPAAPGLDTADISVENGMITGSINGRAIAAMPADDADPNATSFEDGDAMPESGMDPALESAIIELFAAAAQTAEGCQPPESDSESMGTMEARLLIPDQDFGHDSDPVSSGGCIACWAGCSAGAAACIAGVSAACVAALVFYAVCEAAAVGGCALAYLGCVGGCNATGAPCCPVSCGSVACCENEETCLDAQRGVCCSPGKTPCVGETCCSSTQTCIDTGPNAGICCQPEDICGNTCCDPGDSCIASESICCPAEEEPCDDKCCEEGETCLGDGLCCDPINACGSACCDELDSCVESLSLCCGFNSPACGNKCCESGEQCLSGNTCCPIGRGCGNVCCPPAFSCDPDTVSCVGCPNASDTPCVGGGCCPVNMVCAGVDGICCQQGEFYCGGQCRPANECIQ